MEPSKWKEWAEGEVFKEARRLRIGKKRAELLAGFAVRVAGPGEGRGAVKYRIVEARKLRPGQRGKQVDGWFIYEFVGNPDFPEERRHFFSEKEVFKLWKTVKRCVPLNPDLRRDTRPWNIGAAYKFRAAEVASGLKRRKMLPKKLNYAAFFGGENRNRYYFPRYLYLMRVLDYIGYLRFGRVSWRLR